MIIKLLPQCRDDTLAVIKFGNVLTINGGTFDFSPMAEGATLPRTAIASEWFADDVIMQDGVLILTLLLPLPANFSPEQAFPVPMLNVQDGVVEFPRPVPMEDTGGEPEPAPDWAPATGIIDWTQLITLEMKAAANAAMHLSEVKAELASNNAKAVAQIARIQDRVDTLGYGIEVGEATEEDEAEQASLMINITVWKAYKFALGKVTKQPTWPAAPVWPVEPAIPMIEADPEARATEVV